MELLTDLRSLDTEELKLVIQGSSVVRNRSLTLARRSTRKSTPYAANSLTDFAMKARTRSSAPTPSDTPKQSDQRAPHTVRLGRRTGAGRPTTTPFGLH